MVLVWEFRENAGTQMYVKERVRGDSQQFR